MAKSPYVLRDNINMKWRDQTQRETYRDFLVWCDKHGRHPTFVLEELMRRHVKARKGA